MDSRLSDKSELGLGGKIRLSIKLSILDQSPISIGSNATEALRQTTKLVQYAEKWGFERFWVSEHHDSPMFASSSPEILIAHLASATSTIRIGSGGVMLPHYSAYKIAENFKLLEALFPGRIDAGVGRAPGGMPRATYALHNGQYRDVQQFPQQIDDLWMYLTDSIPDDHQYYGLKASPLTESAPPIWMLGSSSNSAAIAAEKGMPYMFAQFINGDGGEAYAQNYHAQFKPSEIAQKPKQAVAIFLACGESEEEAERIVAPLDYSLVMREQGISYNGMPSPEIVKAYSYTELEKARLRENRKRMIVGTPKSARQQIEALARAYHADEIMFVMRTYDPQDTLKSYELISKEFGLH